MILRNGDGFMKKRISSFALLIALSLMLFSSAFMVSATEDATITQEPVYTDPVITEPVYTDPVITEPGYTEPAYTEPLYTEVIQTTVPSTEAVVTQPDDTDDDSDEDYSYGNDTSDFSGINTNTPEYDDTAEPWENIDPKEIITLSGTSSGNGAINFGGMQNDTSKSDEGDSRIVIWGVVLICASVVFVIIFILTFAMGKGKKKQPATISSRGNKSGKNSNVRQRRDDYNDGY